MEMLKSLLGKVFDLEQLKRAWRYYSTYAFLLVAGLPELLPQVTALFPGLAVSPTRMMQYAAIGGLVLRYVKQKGAEAQVKAAQVASDS